jgi:hypothetical protein
MGTIAGAIAIIGVGASMLRKGSSSKHAAGGRQHLPYHSVGSPRGPDTSGAENFIRNLWGTLNSHMRSRIRAMSPKVGDPPLIGQTERGSPTGSAATTWKQWSGNSVPVGSTASHRAAVAGVHANSSGWVSERSGSDASFGSWDEAWDDVEVGGRPDGATAGGAVGGAYGHSPRDVPAGRRMGTRRTDTSHASDW